MAFLRINGLRSIEFGTPGPMRIRLNDFIINGNKRATAGLLKEDYMDEGEEIEFVGERLAILDNDKKQIGIIKVTKVEVLEFKDVPTNWHLLRRRGIYLAMISDKVIRSFGIQLGLKLSPRLRS